MNFDFEWLFIYVSIQIKNDNEFMPWTLRFTTFTLLDLHAENRRRLAAFFAHIFRFFTMLSNDACYV